GGFGGGRPDAAQIASFTMQRYDKNSDGVLSSDEIQAIDAQFRDGTLEADANGDGAVSRDELIQGIKKKFGG
ncbi:MAG: efflux transporter periplasmic adaptor subunit, partial [Planctomycetota bacterium]